MCSIDHSFELCFFRDVAKINLIEDFPKLKKQTFDLVLTLSNGSLAIIEAKAQQGFHTKQLEMLIRARELISRNKRFSGNDIYLIALHSSKYRPKKSTLNNFDALITWKTISTLYPTNREAYDRADSIYGD